MVTAWSTYGKEGLKTLDGLELDEAASQLLEAAKSEEINSSEGTFFGAMLQVRWGEGLKSHIDNLLHKLERRSIGGGRTLKDAFAYIAAMHAENLPILSKDVLAAALHIPFGDLKRAVLTPLGEEAAIATTGQFVFSRHRAIADSALASPVRRHSIWIWMSSMWTWYSRPATYLSGTYVPILTGVTCPHISLIRATIP